MRSLLEENIYLPEGSLLIYGSCVPNVYQKTFKAFSENYDSKLSLCLENNHINMAITKITAILSAKRITKLAFVSVNRSPHCTQMHYIKHEIYRVMDREELPPIENYIIDDNNLYKINEATIELSKNLIKLSNQ